MLMRLAYHLFSASPAIQTSVRRWPLLLALGGLSLLAYWLGLIAPYNLFALQLRPLADIAKLTRGQPVAQAIFVLIFAALSALYYLAWRLCRGFQRRAMWVALITTIVVINGAMLWLYPIGAADIFDNIARGRITAEYGGNPFYETPRQYKADRFFWFTAWRDATSAYGPLWEGLAAGASRLAGDGVLENVLAFKLLGLAFYGGCIALIAYVLSRHAPERALQGVCLFALNPLVIYETAGNGHNDIAMVFFILLGAAALTRGRFTSAVLALTAGALIKFISILLVPVTLICAVRALPRGRDRVAFVVITALACIVLAAAAYAPFWQGGDPLALQRRSTLFSSSLPALAQVYLEQVAGAGPSQVIISRAALVILGALVLIPMWRIGSSPRSLNWIAVIRAWTALLLFYLLFAALWYQAWYAIWPLALAALLPEGILARTTVLLSYASLWKTIIFFFIFPGGQLPPRLWRETWLGPLTLGIVWLYVVYSRFRKRL